MASDGRSEKYRLLNEDAIDVNDDLGPIISDKNFSYRRSNRIWKVLILPFVVASLCLNAFFLVTLANPMQVNQRTKFAGLQPIPAPLYRSTQYGEDSASQEDLERVWNALDISPGLVAFPDEEATLLGLPPADRLPYDNTSGVYLLGAFHQIHCLKSTFQYTTAKHFGRSTGFDYEHIVHCLDSLLQATICAADDFPWVQLPPPRLRQDSSVYQQVQQCKSWDGLLSWARKHSSCYRYDNVTDEFGNFLPPHAIDRYRFCPEGSPYEQVVQEYFQSQGDAGNNDF